MSKLKSCWLGMSIGSKMKVFVILLLLVIITDASFNFYTAQFSVGDVNQILKEISRCETAQDAMHTEAESLINAVDEAVRLARSRKIPTQAETAEDQQESIPHDFSDEQPKEDDQQEGFRFYIVRHYMEDIAVKDIAGYFGYSEAYFCKLFKQYFGHSFVSYLTDYRMQQAEELMRTSTLSIKEIGKAVGYPDPNYFTKVFRRVRGVSPSEFRDLGKQI